MSIEVLEKDNNLHLKYSDTSMSNLSLNEEFSNEYEKRIPILDENKKDFSFKLNRDFFKQIENKKLKLRHKFSFENTAFISDKKELSFTMYNDIDEKYGGLQSISFPISKLESIIVSIRSIICMVSPTTSSGSSDLKRNISGVA